MCSTWPLLCRRSWHWVNCLAPLILPHSLPPIIHEVEPSWVTLNLKLLCYRYAAASYIATRCFGDSSTKLPRVPPLTCFLLTHPDIVRYKTHQRPLYRQSRCAISIHTFGAPSLYREPTCMDSGSIDEIPVEPGEVLLWRLSSHFIYTAEHTIRSSTLSLHQHVCSRLSPLFTPSTCKFIMLSDWTLDSSILVFTGWESHQTPFFGTIFVVTPTVVQ